MRTFAIWRDKYALLAGFTVLLLPLLQLPAYAQGTAPGSIVGSITTEGYDSPFEGAVVQLEELNRNTTSGRDGRYRFNNVPPGTYTLIIDYFGATPKRTRSID